MIGLLVTICAIAAVVTIIHLGGSGTTGDVQPRDRIRNNTVSEEPDEPETDDFIQDEGEDFRFWQRASTVQKETGLWQYYPIIPWNVLPGETVELGVSKLGFKGWEADSKYAPVEFFDERSDEEQTYISFIMPDERVSIAALYENEIPRINYDNQRSAVMSMVDMHEYGALPVPASDDPPPPLRPQPDVIVDMPIPAIVGMPYNVRLFPPVGVTDNGNLDWRFDFPAALDWMTWTYTPDAVDALGVQIGGGRLHNKTGTFPTESGGPYLFSVEIWNTDTGRIIDMYNFRISVRRPGALPELFTTEVPDAMVGVDYFVLFNTGFFPVGSTWDWSTFGGTGLPDSLELWWDVLDYSRGGIRGRPTVEDLENPNYSFQVSIDPTVDTTLLHPEVGEVVSDVFRIKVWEQPVITTPLVIPPPAGPPPFKLLDGIANANGVEQEYSVTFNGSGPIGSDATTDAIVGVGWTWRVTGGSLPPGLDIPPPPAVPPAAGTSAVLGGYPMAAAAGEYTFTIRFMANQNLLQGWVEQTYSIKILQPPRFATLPGLAYGMEGPADASEPLEEPDWYTAPIDIVDFPSGTKWTWSISAGSLPSGLGLIPALPVSGIINEPNIPGALSYPCPLDLSGVPGSASFGDYNFTIELKCMEPGNSNIDGATVSQEFNVKIWPRTYLHISMLGIGNRGYVRRDNNNPADNTGDPGWAGLNAWTAGEAGRYEGKRAIMPGERGIISTNSGGGFVRWEVSPNYNAQGTNDIPLTYSVASRLVNIGGPDSTNSAGVRTGYGIFPAPPAAGQHGYVIINMPIVPFPSSRSEYGGDVFIRAESVGTGRPVITGLPDSRFALRNGMEGALYDATITIGSNDMGGGPNPMKWQVIPEGALPPGLRLDDNPGNRTMIEGIPTQTGTYEFTIRMTLPGTMIIERDYSITITPWDGLGDVNNDGVVDLRDLVLLIRYQDDKSLGAQMNMRNARLSTNGTGTHDPGQPDIRILARYFASSQGSLNS